MAIGDVVQTVRPRAQSNMRLDLVDFMRQSGALTAHQAAMARALLSKPKATAGLPTGETWAGTTTKNPTDPNDGLVEVNTALFVGLDADGNTVIKPAGTVLQVAVPDDSNDYQVYLYSEDLAEETAARRFLPPTAPFTEFGDYIDTAYRGVASLFLRAGGAGAVVASDVAGGVTRALLFLGIANNTGGAVTWTRAANRLETVTTIAARPASSSQEGSATTLRGLANHALSLVAENKWLGSINYTPTAGDNYGAYRQPPAGLDACYRGLPAYVTIGDGSNAVYGDLDRDIYASDDLVLAAAIAALPACGGVIYIKPGTKLNNWAADVTIPEGANVTFMGGVGPLKSRDALLATHDIDFGLYNFVCTGGAADTFIRFFNLNIVSDHATTNGNFIILHDNCHLTIMDCAMAVITVNTVTPVAMITVDAGAAGLGKIYVERVFHHYESAKATIGGMSFIYLGVVPTHKNGLTLLSSTFYGLATGAAGSWSQVVALDVRGEIRVRDCKFLSSGGTLATLPLLWFDTTDNTIGARDGRVIEGCTFRGKDIGAAANASGILIAHLRNVKVCSCTFDTLSLGLLWTATAASKFTADLTVDDCTFLNCSVGWVVSLVDGASVVGLRFLNCTLESCTYVTIGPAVGTAGSFTLQDVEVKGCTFEDTSFRMNESTMHNVDVAGNTFAKGGLGIEPPQFIAPTNATGLYEVTFRKNLVRGFYNVADVEHVYGVFFQAATVRDLDISGNQFLDMQSNIAYVGALSDDGQRVVSVCCTTGELIRMVGNKFHAIGVAVSDNSVPILMEVNSYDRTAAGGAVKGTQVDGNIMADSSSDVRLFLGALHGWQQLSFQHNEFSYLHDKPHTGNGDVDVGGLTTVISMGIKFANNTFRIQNGTGGALARHIVSTSGGAGVNIYSIQHLGNSFSISSGGWASPYGIYHMAVCSHFMVRGNVAQVDGSAATGTFFTDMSGVPSTVDPTLPGVGVAWGSNLNLERQ